MQEMLNIHGIGTGLISLALFIMIRSISAQKKTEELRLQLWKNRSFFSFCLLAASIGLYVEWHLSKHDIADSTSPVIALFALAGIMTLIGSSAYQMITLYMRPALARVPGYQNRRHY